MSLCGPSCIPIIQLNWDYYECFFGIVIMFIVLQLALGSSSTCVVVSDLLISLIKMFFLIQNLSV